MGTNKAKKVEGEAHLLQELTTYNDLVERFVDTQNIDIEKIKDELLQSTIKIQRM